MSIITALPWRGHIVQVAVFILEVAALNCLKPNPAVLKLVHNQLTKRRMKHAVLMRRCGAYCVVSTQPNRCGREVYDAKSSIDNLRPVVTDSGTKAMGCFQFMWLVLRENCPGSQD